MHAGLSKTTAVTSMLTMPIEKIHINSVSLRSTCTPTLEVLAMINDQKRIYSRQAQFMYVAMQHIPYLSKHPL